MGGPRNRGGDNRWIDGSEFAPLDSDGDKPLDDGHHESEVAIHEPSGWSVVGKVFEECSFQMKFEAPNDVVAQLIYQSFIGVDCFKRRPALLVHEAIQDDQHQLLLGPRNLIESSAGTSGGRSKLTDRRRGEPRAKKYRLQLVEDFPMPGSQSLLVTTRKKRARRSRPQEIGLDLVLRCPLVFHRLSMAPSMAIDAYR